MSALSEADYSRLNLFAAQRLQKCTQGLSLSGQTNGDLIHDALLKIVDGDRSWEPTRVQFVPFVCGVIKSMTSNEVATQVNHRPEHLRGEAADIALANYPSSVMAPDGELEARQEKERRNALIVEFYDMLNQYPVAAELYELKRQGLKGPAIQAKLNVSEKEYVRRDQQLRRVFDGLRRWKQQGENDD